MNDSKEPSRSLTSTRLASVDAFRGLTVAGMILVNAQGPQAFETFQHEEWHGANFADLIFPFFLFIVGVSVVLSLSSITTRPGWKVWGKVLFRVLKLFLLGIALNMLFAWVFYNHGLRIAGVLQRIAIVYLACVMAFFYLNWKQQLVLGGSVLILYGLAMTFIPVPDTAQGVMDPGKNLAAWIDNYLLPGRFFAGSWDPEGILSTIPAIVTGISGLLAGYLIRSKLSLENKVILLFLFGFLSYILGNLWGLSFPINKHLWTSSFVLFTSGLAMMTLAAIIWLIEVRNYRRWFQWGVVFGMNAIFAYVMHEALYDLSFVLIAPKTSVNSAIMSAFETFLSPKLASCAFGIGFVLLCYGAAYLLYRKKIFLKV